MKTTLKRTLSYVLVVCMLLSVLPFAASAQDYSWDATGSDTSFATACATLVEGSEDVYQIVAKYVNSDTANKQADGYYQIKIDNKESTDISFLGFQFNTVVAGTYTMNLNLHSSSGSNTYSVYVFSTEYFDDCPNTSTRNDKVADAIASGTNKAGEFTAVNDEEVSVSLTVELDDAPVIVFAGPEDGVTKFLRFTSIGFTYEGTSGETTGPSTDPSEPSTEPSEPEATEPDYTPEELVTMIDAGAKTGASMSFGGGYKVADDGYFQKKFNTSTTNPFVGMLFENIVPGTYQMDVLLNSSNSASDVYVAVIPADEISALGSGATTATGNLIVEKKLSDTVKDGNEVCAINATFAGDPNNNYFVFFLKTSGDASFLRLDGINLTKTADVYAMNGNTPLTSEQAVIDALSVSGNTVELCQNVNVGSSAFLNSGSTVELNGFTLSGDSVATVTVAGKGTVSASVRPANVAPGYVALADSGSYTVVKYGVKIDATAVAKDNNVSFWYRVSLGSDALYALAANDDTFSIGAEITVNGNSAKAVFADELINAWADAMATDDGTVCFCVTINNAADISMDLVATVNGVTSGSAISYTA